MRQHLGWALASIVSFTVIGVGAASAADMPMKAMPAPIAAAPIYNWTGFYVGLNLGGAWNDTRDDVFPTGCFLTNVALRWRSHQQSAALGFSPSDGLRLHRRCAGGYNWQAANWVFGIEGDINYSGISDGSSINRPVVAPLVGNFIHTESDKLNWFGTFRGRLGMTVTPSFLIYGTGGLAFGQVKSASAVSFTTTTDVYAGSIDDTRFGWTVGGGGEWMIAPQWSIKAEYLFVDLGKASYTQTCITAVCAAFTPPPSYQTDLRVHEHVARVGVNYHFGGPVVARY